MRMFIRIISSLLVISVFISCFEIANVYAAPAIYDFWIDASSAGPKSYSGRKETDMVRWWKYGYKTYYIMLPNSANLSRLKVYYNATNVIQVNGQTITSGSETSLFRDGGDFNLNCGGEIYHLTIKKASQIPSLFISTASGSLDRIHADKSYEESGLMLLVDEKGNVVYNDYLDYIKGRGNATWVDYPKKPYNIKLNKSTDLLGMGKSKRWCLIANWVDKTHLHNKLAYDIAQEVGIEFTANTRHVDLYINNEYQGLYVLTERNNVEENHINITDLEELTEKVNNVTDLSVYGQSGTNSYVKDSYKYYNIPKDPSDITGGYLIEFELSPRYSSEPSGFVTKRGQAIVIKSPEYASKKQVEYIKSFYQDFEDAVYSPTGYNQKGKHYTDYVDLDSLVKIYLLHEFCLNLDAGISSFFFYKDSDRVGDGKLHAAPPWDFDNAFGLPGPRDYVDLRDPTVFWANVGRIYEDPSWTPHLMSAVYKHKDFVQRAIRIWHTEFVPPINKIIYPDNTNPTKIVQKMGVYRDTIKDSALMNNIFWYNSFNTIDQRIANLTAFMKTRATFLCDNWKTNINDLEVEYIDPVVYNGSSVKPKVVIKDMGDVLKEGHEYNVEYFNNNSVGKASVKITMQKYYTGTKTVYFTIVDESKAGLVDAINKAKNQSPKNYSTAAWNTLQTKLSAARTVCEKTNATKAEIDNATNELLRAMNISTDSKVDKTKLQNAINLAESKNSSDYTTESWNLMQSKLNSAKAVYSSAAAKQTDVDKITEELMNAIQALIPVNSQITPAPTPGQSSQDTNEKTNSPVTKTNELGGNLPVVTEKKTALWYILAAVSIIVIAGGITGGVIFYMTKKKNIAGKETKF